MTARMEINQAKLEADRKADHGHMQGMLTRMDADRKDDQEKMKDMMESQIGFLVSRVEAVRNRSGRYGGRNTIHTVREE
jgi:hypothetical protein